MTFHNKDHKQTLNTTANLTNKIYINITLQCHNQDNPDFFQMHAPMYACMHTDSQCMHTRRTHARTHARMMEIVDASRLQHCMVDIRH